MTSGNGNTNSSQPNGESKPAQALAKSHILTHLIEGFVIQEGAEPFPVERPSFSIESLRRNTADSKMDSISPKEIKSQQEPMLTCELCGRVDFAYIFKRSKRFCSTVCAKRYNVGCTKRMGLFPNRKTTLENMKKQRALNGNHKNTNLESKKKATIIKVTIQLLPPCRSLLQLLCPLVTRSTLHRESPVNVQPCLATKDPQLPYHLPRGCLRRKALSITCCPPVSCPVTLPSGT
ncbi:polyhomeotic-like protein 2 isoform X2 [Amphiprion ocellaris]|uniref:polyhomeotic-like protein 2 isoform X2 n=1 Tax=Amphiprion ocellaris TaxID=80972 RepID=UPI001649B00F|nr:polyhomeotic-like protein 2 isoform X2 [Amphiprion ocellaris]